MVHSAAGIIKNVESGLVLDGCSSAVAIQAIYDNPTPSQLWTLEPVGNGAFFIRNKASGLVLDIEGGVLCEADIITYIKHGGENQQWFIHPDNTIVCASGNLALDIPESNFFPGTVVIAYPKHGGENQKFVIEHH